MAQTSVLFQAEPTPVVSSASITVRQSPTQSGILA